MSDSSLPPSTPGRPRAGEPPQSGDAEHDAWLRAALRHAPDADASPPEALRRSILDEARAAAFVSAQANHPGSTTARGASTPRPHGVIEAAAAFWKWLARPPVAAAFASVMAATLVGVMWWDRPLDETLPAATPPVASVRQSTSTSERPMESKVVPSTPAEPADRSTSSTPSPGSTSSTTTPPSFRPVPSKPPAIEDKRAAAAVDRLFADKRRAEPTLQSAAKPHGNLDAARPPDATATGAAALQPFPAQIAPASLAKAAPTPPSASPPLPEVSQATTRSSTPVHDALGRDALPAARAVVAAPPAPDAVPPPEWRARAAMGASVSQGTTRPLSDVLVSLAGDPSRWSVQRASGDRVAVDDAVRAWLTRVDDSGRWRLERSIGETAESTEATEATEAAEAAAKKSEIVVSTPAITLTLLHDGRIDTVVRIGAGRVVVERRGDAARGPSTAVLSEQAAAALVDSLPGSAR